MWTKIRAFVGRLWGWATTQLLAGLVTVQAILLDSNAQAFIASVPWAPKVVAGIGLAVLVFRQFAPPPKASP